MLLYGFAFMIFAWHEARKLLADSFDYVCLKDDLVLFRRLE
jgi:hypothetical protein